MLTFLVRSGELCIQFIKLSDDSPIPSAPKTEKTNLLYKRKEKKNQTMKNKSKNPCFIPYIRRNTTRQNIAIFENKIAQTAY